MARSVRSSALLAFLLIAVLVLSSCATKAPAGGAGGDLVKAAKAEGTLTTIALPHDWCNYGEAIEGFKTKYGLQVNELNPDAGSGDEIEAN